MDLSADIQSQLTQTIATLQLQASSRLTSPASAAALSASGANLQNWYNQLLTGGLSSADIAALQSDLGSAQKQSLAAAAAADQKRLVIGIVIGVALITGGIIFYKLKFKNR